MIEIIFTGELPIIVEADSVTLDFLPLPGVKTERDEPGRLLVWALPESIPGANVHYICPECEAEPDYADAVIVGRYRTLCADCA